MQFVEKEKKLQCSVVSIIIVKISCYQEGAAAAAASAGAGAAPCGRFIFLHLLVNTNEGGRL